MTGQPSEPDPGQSGVRDRAAPTGDGVLGGETVELDPGTAASLWSASGCRALGDPALGVPLGLVGRVVGLVEGLDRRGAGLAELLGNRGLGVLSERSAAMGLPASGAISAGGACRFVRAADGWLALSLARDDDRDLVPAWLEASVPRPTGAPGGGGGLGSEPLDPVWAVVESVARRRPADELLERAVLLGLPCSVVGETDDARPAIATALGPGPPSALDGALVVSLASLWAGPLCADVLSRLGARVVTVESTGRPDGGRLAPRFFAALHGRTESVALDLTSSSGRRTLATLVGRADVVIEGSRPRALEQMGIDAPELVASGGPRIWASITGHGRDPAHRERVGFGDDAAAAGGLVGWVAGEPRFVADAVADPLTGLAAAHAVAELAARGGRWLLDIALARVARSALGPWVPWTDDAGPAQRPRGRLDPGASLPLGRDTGRVLAELGIV